MPTQKTYSDACDVHGVTQCLECLLNGQYTDVLTTPELPLEDPIMVSIESGRDSHAEGSSINRETDWATHGRTPSATTQPLMYYCVTANSGRMTTTPQGLASGSAADTGAEPRLNESNIISQTETENDTILTELRDPSLKHNVIPFKQRGPIPRQHFEQYKSSENTCTNTTTPTTLVVGARTEDENYLTNFLNSLQDLKIDYSLVGTLQKRNISLSNIQNVVKTIMEGFEEDFNLTVFLIGDECEVYGEDARLFLQEFIKKKINRELQPFSVILDRMKAGIIASNSKSRIDLMFIEKTGDETILNDTDHLPQFSRVCCSLKQDKFLKTLNTLVERIPTGLNTSPGTLLDCLMEAYLLYGEPDRPPKGRMSSGSGISLEDRNGDHDLLRLSDSLEAMSNRYWSPDQFLPLYNKWTHIGGQSNEFESVSNLIACNQITSNGPLLANGPAWAVAHMWKRSLAEMASARHGSGFSQPYVSGDQADTDLAASER